MKKGDLVATYGRKRAFYDESYTPLTRGEIVKDTAKEVEIYWYDSLRSAVYPKAKVTEKGKVKKAKDGKDYQILEIIKERK